MQPAPRPSLFALPWAKPAKAPAGTPPVERDDPAVRHAAARVIQDAYLRRQQYKKLMRGEDAQALYGPFGPLRPGMIRACSAANMRQLHSYFDAASASRRDELPYGPMKDEERAFVKALVDAPMWLSHYTSDEGKAAIESSKALLSLDEMKRRNLVCASPGATAHDVRRFANTGFVFFNLTLGEFSKVWSEFGLDLCILRAESTELLTHGWVCLFELMTGLNSFSQELREFHRRRYVGDDVVRYERPSRGHFSSEVVRPYTDRSLVFHGPHIRLGIALSALVELRFIDPTIAAPRLTDTSPSGIAFTMARLFAPEAKIPRRVDVSGAAWDRYA